MSSTQKGKVPVTRVVSPSFKTSRTFQDFGSLSAEPGASCSDRDRNQSLGAPGPGPRSILRSSSTQLFDKSLPRQDTGSAQQRPSGAGSSDSSTVQSPPSPTNSDHSTASKFIQKGPLITQEELEEWTGRVRHVIRTDPSMISNFDREKDKELFDLFVG